VDIKSVFRCIDTGVLVLVGEIRIFCTQQVAEMEIGLIYHLANDSVDGLRISELCEHRDWFKGGIKYLMHMGWC
jgi:hypothetical protein